jgi:hypothetical protein
LLALVTESSLPDREVASVQTQALKERTVIVRFPDGASQYWLTDRGFAPGQRISQNGHEWVVSEVIDPDQTGTHVTVTLCVDAR